MTILAEQATMTAEQFLSLPNPDDYELVEGQLRERKEMGADSSHVAALISRLITNHVIAARLGFVFDSSATYRCFESPHTIRRADVSFIRTERMPQVPQGEIRIPPDLVVEVVSPNDLAYDVNNKVEQYLSAGVPLIWVVYPNTRTVRIHRGDGSVADLRQDQTITAESILTGFSSPVAEFFPAPTPAAPQKTE